MRTLFDPIRLGDIDLANRVVMAPLTRNRSPDGVPNALMAAYYGQRADPQTGAGLLISEASQISPQGQGYGDTPGVYNRAQVDGWRLVTDAVHARGGRIVCQLWHVGRISHASLQPGGGAPVSSTARAAQVRTWIAGELHPCSAPRALSSEEVTALVADYAHAARCAIDAGFDGVEIHAANGYLLDQFLRDNLNDRSDEWGGSLENRTRLLTDVVAAVAGEVGAGRMGVRLSPVSPVNDSGQDSHPQATYGRLVERMVERLAPQRLAFLHVVEGQTGGARDIAPFDYAALRRGFGGPWMVNNGYDRTLALQAVASGQADLVAFGRPFIGNPDLGRRLREDLPWSPSDRKTYYGGGAAGYTDYAEAGAPDNAASTA